MGTPTRQVAVVAVERVWRRLYVANMAGGAVVTAYLTVSGPPSNRPGGFNGPLAAAALFVVFAVVLLPVTRALSGRQLGPVRAWLATSREPSEVERAQALAGPRRAGLIALECWLGIATVTALITSGGSIANGARVGVGVAVAGAAVAVLTSLLAERGLRPAIAVVLAGAPPARDRVLGVQRRLVLFWLLGSGIPLAGILVSPLGHDLTDRFVVVGILALAGVGLIAGLSFTVVAARSVAEPLSKVRDAMTSVGDGCLDTELTVDDDGEVGRLQAGFNHMAAGLRERQQLADLFGRHVGEDVARQALANGVRLGGEQREITAFFVDMVGSTALAETKPATEVVELLNHFFETVVHAVAAEGGWVNKFEGDAALCVFGAPVAQTDHAERALRAARRLRDGLLKLRASHPHLDFGIGVATGSVVAGNVGSEQRYEYTVIGSPVNEAARLTEHAKARASRVLISDSTIAAADATVGYRPAGEVALRGLSRPTAVHEPVDDDAAAITGQAATTNEQPTTQPPAQP